MQPILTSPEHVQRAAAHADFEREVSSLVPHAEKPGWQVTVLYYVALHRVSAFLAKHGMHPDTHPGRRDCLKNRLKETATAATYDTLEMWSRESRYNYGGIKESQVESARTMLEKISTSLKV